MTRLPRFRVAAWLPLVALAIAAGESHGVAATDAPSQWALRKWRWLRVPVRGQGGEGLVAVAADSGGASRVAVADLEGVSLGADRGPFRFAARVPGATDLAFAPDGGLWIGSIAGLWRLSAEGRLEDRSPAPGEPARAIHRVVAAGDRVAVGTEAGAFVLEEGEAWRRLSDGLPIAPVTAVAVSKQTGALWLVVGEDLWSVGLEPGARARLVAVEGAPSGVAPADVIGDLPGCEVAVLYPRALAVLELEESASSPPAFRVLRPVWPPGAVARRLTAVAGRLWLATDLGLLHAPAASGPWRRSEAPAGSAPVRAVAAAGEAGGLLAATEVGLLHGSPVLLADVDPAEGSPFAFSPETTRPDPDVRAVHAASLRYLDLGPEHMRELRDGLRFRGWIPTLSLRVDGVREKSWDTNDDQTFVSGDMRYLRDRGKDRSLDLAASVVMTWSLGDLAFDPSAIDISREHRLVVSLRDSVIDEINQLYFERRALLERMQAEDAPEGPDRRALELRAAELAAGLDAWTGGWFSGERIHPPNGQSPTPKETR